MPTKMIGRVDGAWCYPFFPSCREFFRERDWSFLGIVFLHQIAVLGLAFGCRHVSLPRSVSNSFSWRQSVSFQH